MVCNRWRPIPKVVLKKTELHMWWAPLRAFCIVNGVLYVTVNEWNDGMSYSIINYSYPNDKTPWMAKSGYGVGRLSLFLFLVSEQTFCGEPVDAFTVNWTALYFVFFIQWTFLIFFCIHCDRTAQEVACARHSKNKKKNSCFSFSFACAAQFSFFFSSSANLPVRLYRMLRESHQKKTLIRFHPT